MDDDPQARAAVLALLESEGIVARGSADGTEALAEVQRHRPSVVLIEVSVPRLGRVQLGRVLRADDRLADIPTISMWDGVQNTGGMNGEGPILMRPVDTDLLLRLLRNYLP